MKKVLEVAGVVLLTQGVMGLVHKYTGWSRGGLLGFVRPLDGYEVYASVVLIVLAGALFAVARRHSD
ncbi:hypothetical protein [Streptomyces tsukubensis]|uniref:Uncharacterized protein n=1 Tax=Streptomyces tsukubensis TaxID=83656 RepID=A0A1V4ACG9_9ACTN|nr:hypothetical protein [Streptomyces tsukubensis]OON81654.1 hypothetical protein B1H18_05725 [Streptomyces tsukubensis]QFR96429.1 hypothetical protein GBW32_29565 [Streptomyces tsukubensis]